MIIFGSRSRRTSVGEVYPDSQCDNCGKPALRPIVLQYYFHIFWIPFFPTVRQVIYGCAHCKEEIAPHQASIQLRDLAPKFAAKVSPPHYMMSGIYLSALLFIGYSIAY